MARNAAPNAGSRRIFPTVFGGAVLVIVVLSAALRLAVADASVMGLVWAGLASVLVIGVLFPAVSVRLLRLNVLGAPTDLEVGQLSSIEIGLSGRVSGLMLRCGLSPMFVVDITSPAQLKLPLEVAGRGAYDHVPIEVSTDAPFSVVTASERRIVPLPRQLLVGPHVIDGVAQIGEIKGEDLETPALGHAVSGDTVRSVRPYVSGDPSHMVHWPSSARLGSLVVRELEPPQTHGVAVVVALHGEPGTDPVEEAVSRAAGVALNALERGARVMLCTHSPQGPLCEEVLKRLDVQRRLAVALPGAPGAAPEGWPTQVVSDSSAAPERGAGLG